MGNSGRRGEAGRLGAVETYPGRLTSEEAFYLCGDLLWDPSLPEVVDETFVVNVIERSCEIHKYN